MDDPYVSCPYDSVHQVPRSRLQRHIIKCEWRNPDWQACPYNATHRLPKDQIKAHVSNCPSKTAIIPEDKPPKVIATLCTPKSTLQKEYLPETDPNHEMWDN